MATAMAGCMSEVRDDGGLSGGSASVSATDGGTSSPGDGGITVTDGGELGTQGAIADESDG